jgi:hypothetical protein
MANDLDETLETAIEGGFRQVRAIDDAYERGELDDAGWYQAMAAIAVPAYTSAATAQGGSGHSGTAAEWEWSRGIVGQAIDRSGTFLDVGCANGLLMESVERWARERGFEVVAHGLDIARELADLAVRRVPAFSGCSEVLPHHHASHLRSVTQTEEAVLDGRVAVPYVERLSVERCGEVQEAEPAPPRHALRLL